MEARSPRNKPEEASDLHHIGDSYTLPDGSITTIDILMHDGSFYGKLPGEVAEELGKTFVHYDASTGKYNTFNSNNICINPQNGRCELINIPLEPSESN